jgi:eukaryotic-like serine/threonine-protein kinase
MFLMIGKTLGHYKVGEQLGRGGMGEVYLADDLNLNRKVALKFLPDAFTGDPERMARFEREAKLLATLNHPNIAAIYGLEEAEGKRFLVLELVEGETLAQRLSKGPLPVEEALEVCRQIADGLEAAHEKGVIHRDLKPANVMITAEEKVKILDFGLAKALAGESQNVDASQSPTLTDAMTQRGVILGTAAYMSPEQAKGKAVDKRADIWAFGCILFECLTGKRPFEGETITETLAAILKGEPNWDALPATIPSNIRFVLRRCLEKDVNSRFHDAADVRIEIVGARDICEPTAAAKRSYLAWIWAAVATLIVIALAVPTYLYFRGPEPAEVMRFDVTVPLMPSSYAMAISPDGHWIAYVASSSGSAISLFVREIGSVKPRQIEETEGASYPFWSPDSKSIGFAAGGRLKRVDVSGKPQRDICAAALFRGGTWNNEGIIVFSGEHAGLSRVSAEGGESIAITTLDKSRKEVIHYLPNFLPDEHNFLYVTQSGEGSDIYVGSLDSKKQTQLLAGASMAVYAEPGYLLFQRERTLFAQPFNAKKLMLSVEPVSIADNLLTGFGESAIFGASQNGLLIYRATEVQTGFQFAWFDRTGKQLGVAGEPASYQPAFDLSPDGKQIAAQRYNTATKRYGIWLIECDRNVATPLSSDPSLQACPLWSPDGSRIAFSSNRKGRMDIFVKNANGIGEETALVESEVDQWTKDWSKDDRYIAHGDSTGHIYALPLFGDRKSFPIVPSSANLNMPAFSFDGKWVAYSSDESGTYQVYVVSFPAADQRRTVSTGGGVQPRWRQDGKELYYLTLDGKMMAVDIKGENKIEPGIPHMLFDTELAVIWNNNQYEVTSDGQRFLLLKPLSGTIPTPITVVLNWTSLLKK